MLLVSDLGMIIQDSKDLNKLMDFLRIKNITHGREHREFGCKRKLFCHKYDNFIFLFLCNSSIARMDLRKGSIEYSDFILEQTGPLGDLALYRDAKIRIEDCGIKLSIPACTLAFLFPFYELTKEGVSVFYAYPDGGTKMVLFRLGPLSGYLHFFYYPSELKFILDVHIFDVGVISFLGHASEKEDLVIICDGNNEKRFIMGENGIRRYKGEDFGRSIKIEIASYEEEYEIKEPEIVGDKIVVCSIFDGEPYEQSKPYRYGIVWKEFIGRQEGVFSFRRED